MSSKQSKPSSKKQKRDDKSDSEDSDDDLQPIHFFVPGENINAAVLVEYITQYVDSTARITSSHHPTDKTRTGFNVLAKKTLNAVSLRDLINDSRDWDLETQDKRFKKNPYRYAESDTARRRARQGASKGGAVRPQRQQRETSSEPAESQRRDKAVTPQGASGYPVQYGQYAPPQPHQYQNPQGTYYPPPPGRAETSGAYIHNTTISYTSANMPQYPVQSTSSPYPSGGYPQISKQEPGDYHMSPMVAASTRPGPRVPQPPDQPGPDTFDDDKSRISQAMEMAPSRQGSIAPGEDASRSYNTQGRRPSNYEEMMRRAAHGR